MAKFMEAFGEPFQAPWIYGCFASLHGTLYVPAPLKHPCSARCTRPPIPQTGPQQPLLRLFEPLLNLLLVLYRELFILPQWLQMVGKEEQGASDPQAVGHMRLRM